MSLTRAAIADKTLCQRAWQARWPDVTKGSAMDRELLSRERDTVAQALPPATAPLTLTDNAGRCLLRFDRPGKWRVGRAAECDVILAEPTVSRHHCVLTFSDGGLRVTDTGSTSGTLVSGQRIAGSAALGPGDTLTLGRAELSIRAGAQGVPPEPDTEGFDVPPPLPPAAPAGSGPDSGQAPVRPLEPAARSGARRDEHRGPGLSDFRLVGGQVTVRGIARDATVRSAPLLELGSEYPAQILTLSVHTYDARGDPGVIVSVEMTGLSLHGPPPTDGEEVTVTGRFSTAGVLEADEIRLVRSNASVRPGGRRLLKLGRRAGIVFLIFFLSMFAVVAGFIIYQISHTHWGP